MLLSGCSKQMIKVAAIALWFCLAGIGPFFKKQMKKTILDNCFLGNGCLNEVLLNSKFDEIFE